MEKVEKVGWSETEEPDWSIRKISEVYWRRMNEW
jgi:hypothetical protein